MNTIEPVIDAYTTLVPFFNDGEEGVNDVIFADFVLNYTEGGAKIRADQALV